MPESDYEQFIEELDRLAAGVREKINEHSELIKKAERASWDAAIMQQARQAWDEGQRLNQLFQDLISAAEAKLRGEGIDIEEFERALRSRRPKEMRLWKQELRPEDVSSTGQTIEERLAVGLDELRSHLPEEWWREQVAARERLGGNYLLEPLVLYGTHNCRGVPGSIHRYAYALMLAYDVMQGRDELDIYVAAALVPVVAALCSALSFIKSVKNGIGRLEMLPNLPSADVDSAIYEILTAARMAERGRDVELLGWHFEKTPDIRICDMHFPAVAECKRQSRLSAYELEEVNRLGEIFSVLTQRRRREGLVGELRIDYNTAVNKVPAADVIGIVLESLRGSFVMPSFNRTLSWGQISFSPLDPSITLPSQTRLYSPRFLEHVFGWRSHNADYDGICAVVENSISMRIGRAELPFCIKWRVEDPQSIDRKARSIVSVLKEAAEQIPVGEGGFLYLAFEDSLREPVADRRTQRILELLETLYLKWRHALVMRIVVNRLYPQALDDGLPDLIESGLQVSPQQEDLFEDDMPTCIYTSGR